MSLPALATILGIFAGVLLLLVIFSLLTMAPRRDEHLDRLRLGEAGGWPETSPTQVGKCLEKKTVKTRGWCLRSPGPPGCH